MLGLVKGIMYPSLVHDLTCHFHVFCVLKRHKAVHRLTWVRTPDLGRDFRLSKVSTHVGTSDGHTHLQAKWLGVRTSGMSRDFRLSGVPSYIGTFDTNSHWKNILRARGVLECLSFDFIFMLEHYIFLRPAKFASLFIVRRILNSKTKITPLESAYWVIAATYLIKITLVPNLDVINTPKPT